MLTQRLRKLRINSVLRHCERSEAIQCFDSHEVSGLPRRFAPRNERLIRPSSARRTLRRRTATLGAAATRGNQVIDRIQGMAQLRGGFGGHWQDRKSVV